MVTTARALGALFDVDDDRHRAETAVMHAAERWRDALIADDESIARAGLRRMLGAFEWIEVVAEAAHGPAAVDAIEKLRPDLVFLDIQMPGFDGFSVVSGLADIEPPLFVFVTAYQEHAVRAFEANAVNYLMKPVDEDKLADTLDRVKTRMSEKRSAEEAEMLKTVLAEVAPDAIEAMPDEIVEATNGQIDALAQRLPGLKGKTALLSQYVFPTSQLVIVADPKDGASGLFTRLGMSLPPKLVDEAGVTGGRLILSPERIDALSADVVVLLPNGGSLDDMMKLPGFADALR